MRGYLTKLDLSKAFRKTVTGLIQVPELYIVPCLSLIVAAGLPSLNPPTTIACPKADSRLVLVSSCGLRAVMATCERQPLNRRHPASGHPASILPYSALTFEAVGLLCPV